MLLAKGSVKVTQVDEDGNTVILRLVRPDEVIGELVGTRQDVHSSTAEARTSCQVLLWDKPVFDALAERFPTLQRNAMRILAKRLNDLECRFSEVSKKRVPQRLALELTRLLPRVGRKVGNDVQIDLTREELAQMTATTLFTVSRQLCKWEEQGIVSPRRLGVVIRNPLSLMTISEL